MLALNSIQRRILNKYSLLHLNTGSHQRLIGFRRSFQDYARKASTDTSIESVYQKKTPIEHVLLRPGMYVGAVEPTEDIVWVYDRNTQKMFKKPTTYIPALLKVFDEILVNAADNKQRCGKTKRIDVKIDLGMSGDQSFSSEPRITIRNDGSGVPVQMHRKEKVYVPELVFGQLLTGSNFDDSKGRLTGGRHGYGAKLTNIFSKEFTVETLDSKRGLHYTQTWTDNMHQKAEALVTDAGPDQTDFTQVSFVPDLEKLGFKEDMGLDENHMEMLLKRVVDVAGCVAPVEVYFNGLKIPVNSFQEYMGLYKSDGALLCTKVNKRWEVGIELSDTGQFEQVSFVNCMATTRGGSHINLVLNQLLRRLGDHIAKRHPDLNVTGPQIKSNVFLFVNSLIENPTFDSQMKETLTSKQNAFGSNCILTEAFFKEVLQKTKIIEQTVAFEQIRQQATLQKKTGRRSSTLNIPKLEDAHFAGTNKSHECTLILTEGDSAKALAVAGLEVIGRERYGVFPLRGKLLNVREATVKQLSENNEILNLCNILGLDFEKTYEDGIQGELRYGKVMVMTDQDHDGSHIKGLVINFFHYFWPKLLEHQDFMQTFITPLLKASSGKQTMPFYSMPEYEQWQKMLVNDSNDKKWKIKYYKGLGTSTSKEAKEYFKDLDRHLKQFLPINVQDANSVELAFSKSKIEARKEWLLSYKPEDFNSTEDESLTIQDFVNNELIHFSHADNIRSIPSVVDGLKPSQRKVLHACFKRKLRNEIKVAQLAGYCAEHTAYHHGEASLTATIVNMAQDFVGSNNIPLLKPEGQFGTRAQGGKDAASPRYIFTTLTRFARLIFPEVDDQLLCYLEDEGLVVEPVHFVPIIPLLLVNGTQGIGTGWSTYIPPHNPLDIIQTLEGMLENKPNNSSLKPWFKGFKGSILLTKTGFFSRGTITVQGTNQIIIEELPIGRWTHDYKEFLAKLVKSGKIRSFTEHHTVEAVKFKISVKPSLIKSSSEEDLIQMFKLQTSHGMKNMHAFDAQGRINRYSSPDQILQDFYKTRLELYFKRKQVLERLLLYEFQLINNRKRFIELICSGKVDIVSGKKSKPEIEELLSMQNFQTMAELESIRQIKNLQPLSDNQTGTKSETFSEAGISDKDSKSKSKYEYLLNMSISSFSSERICSLSQEDENISAQLNSLKMKSASDLWVDDLTKLKDELIKTKQH